MNWWPRWATWTLIVGAAPAVLAGLWVGRVADRLELEPITQHVPALSVPTAAVPIPLALPPAPAAVRPAAVSRARVVPPPAPVVVYVTLAQPPTAPHPEPTPKPEQTTTSEPTTEPVASETPEATSTPPPTEQGRRDGKP